MNEHRLTLYTRKGCPLCDEMAAQLEAHLAGLAILVDSVDVDTDPELKAQYGWDVPLLVEGGVEICRHEFNLLAFKTWFNKQPADI